MPIRRLPSIHDGGSGSGSGSGRYSSSGSNCVGWMIGCSGTPVEDFCSVINQLFYHTRQGSFVVCPASEFLGKLAAHLRQHSLRQIFLAGRIVCIYTILVIRSYHHNGLKLFAETGSTAGIHPPHATRLRKLLTALNVASQPADMDAPGNNLHPLKGELGGHWSVKVNGNWRLTFSFDGEDVVLVDYQDYH